MVTYKTYLSIVVAAALLASLGCSPVHGPDRDQSSELEAIEATANRFVNAVRSGDADALSELFTRDAIYAANNGQLLQGQDEILRAARQWVQTPMQPSVSTLRAKVHGDFAYLFQRYSNAVRMPMARALESLAIA
jgi:uncharacterized protein (TIGR02246 family)